MIEENKRNGTWTPPERNYNDYETIKFVVGKSENLEDYKIVLEQIKNKNVVEE